MRKEEESGVNNSNFGGKISTLIQTKDITVSYPMADGPIIKSKFRNARNGLFAIQDGFLKTYQNDGDGIDVDKNLFPFNPTGLVYLPRQFGTTKKGSLRQRIIDTIKQLKPNNRYYNSEINWEYYGFQVIPMVKRLIAAPFNPFGHEHGPTLTKVTEHPYPDTLPESQYYEYLLSYLLLATTRRYVGLSIERETNRILDLDPNRFNRDVSTFKKLFKLPKAQSTLFGKEWVVDQEDDEEIDTQVFTEDFITRASGEHLTSREAYLNFRKTLESEEYTAIRERLLTMLKTTLGSRYNSLISDYEAYLQQAQDSSLNLDNEEVVPVVIMFPRTSKRHLIQPEYQCDVFIFDHVPELKNILAKMGFADDVCPYPSVTHDYFHQQVYGRHPFFRFGNARNIRRDRNGFGTKDHPSKAVYGGNTYEFMTPKKAMVDEGGYSHELENNFYRLTADNISSVWQRPVSIPVVEGVGLPRTPVMTHYLPMLLPCRYTQADERHPQKMHPGDSVWFSKNMKNTGGLSNTHVWCFGQNDDLENDKMSGEEDIQRAVDQLSTHMSVERTSRVNQGIFISCFEKTHQAYYGFTQLNRYRCSGVIKPSTLLLNATSKSIDYDLGDSNTVLFHWFSDYDFELFNHFRDMCSLEPATQDFNQLERSSLIASPYNHSVVTSDDPLNPIGNEKEVAKAYYTDREKSGVYYVDPNQFDDYWDHTWAEKFRKYHGGEEPETYDDKWYWNTLTDDFKLNTLYKPYDRLKVNVVLLNEI